MEKAARAVLVTGGAKRLGRAIALELARRGWAVAVHHNSSAAEAEETVAALRAAGARAAALKADFASEDEVRGAMAQAREAVGPLTALVNNASVFENDGIATMTRQSWDKHIEVNLRAPLVLSQFFAGQLPDGADGAIVNILDQRVLKPTPEYLSYGASKAGLYWLTVTLAQALAPRIRVNAVAPGPTLRGARQSEDHFRRQSKATVLGRGATPEEIAAATIYLIEAAAVTGQTLAVDGGQHLIWRAADIEGME